jgi:hypothetical protein
VAVAGPEAEAADSVAGPLRVRTPRPAASREQPPAGSPPRPRRIRRARSSTAQLPRRRVPSRRARCRRAALPPRTGPSLSRVRSSATRLRSRGRAPRARSHRRRASSARATIPLRNHRRNEPEPPQEPTSRTGAAPLTRRFPRSSTELPSFAPRLRSRPGTAVEARITGPSSPGRRAPPPAVKRSSTVTVRIPARAAPEFPRAAGSRRPPWRDRDPRAPRIAVARHPRDSTSGAGSAMPETPAGPGSAAGPDLPRPRPETRGTEREPPVRSR